MSLFKRLRIWELLGKGMNSRPGAFFLAAFRGVIEKAARPVAAGKSDERPTFTPFAKGLREARVSLVTTTGVHLDDQEPFDTAAALGDSSFRPIPWDADPSRLRIAHTHYPHERAEKDINVIFPLERLREPEGEDGGRLERRRSRPRHGRECHRPLRGRSHHKSRKSEEPRRDGMRHP